MCNAELIHTAQMLAGIAEECHTYAKWKAMGYQVKRGSKPLFSTMIWKYASRKNKETNEEESSMFMKKAHFFGRSQVYPIRME